MRWGIVITLVSMVGGCAIVADEGATGNDGLTGITNDGGAADSAADSAGGACFAASELPFITPREPTSSGCVASGALKRSFSSEQELLDLLVGSWGRCGTSESWFLSHDGFVIGGDRTFRFLEGPSRTPTEVLGRVKLIPNGDGYQVDVERSDGTNMLLVAFVGDDRVDIVETGGSGTFERLAPGVAAIPTTYRDSGACSLVGTWDSDAGLDGAPKKSSGTFAFDGSGHFVGGARGADVCTSPTIRGTYRLVGDKFEIVTSTGMGCPSTYAAGFRVAFSEDCRVASLSMTYDNCTGGRHSIAYNTLLTKR